MANHCDGRRFGGLLFLWQEAASKRDRSAEHSEVVGRNVPAGDAYGIGLRTEAESHALTIGREAIEDALPGAVIQVIRIRERIEGFAAGVGIAVRVQPHTAIGAPNLQKPRRLRYAWPGTKQLRVSEAENGGGAGDADPK